MFLLTMLFGALLSTIHIALCFFMIIVLYCSCLLLYCHYSKRINRDTGRGFYLARIVNFTLIMILAYVITAWNYYMAFVFDYMRSPHGEFWSKTYIFNMVILGILAIFPDLVKNVKMKKKYGICLYVIIWLTFLFDFF